jgi:hypothetical protein
LRCKSAKLSFKHQHLDSGPTHCGAVAMAVVTLLSVMLCHHVL